MKGQRYWGSVRASQNAVREPTGLPLILLQEQNKAPEECTCSSKQAAQGANRSLNPQHICEIRKRFWIERSDETIMYVSY